MSKRIVILSALAIALCAVYSCTSTREPRTVETTEATKLAKRWKPATGPLMTRWAKDVSPTNVHSEYPRPQMVRKEWMNLNGMWEIQFAGEDKPVPILVPFPPESALSGVMRHGEHMIYTRKFEVP